MIEQVAKYIAKHKLLEKEKKHLVALSGGADSVCLLLLLKDMGYDIHAVHCNFMLRGDESNRDEEFCKTLCKENNIELHITHFDTKTYAEVHKVSIEMAARELRYAYFEQLRVAIDAADIVVAHHRDDNVETFLMNIIRGTGIHGLQAIKPRNGKIIRPLLCVSRAEIEDYLVARCQAYVTDSTNLIDDVTRNKIRLNLLPMLESINPAVRKNICKTIENVAEAVKVVDASMQKGHDYIVKGAQLHCKSAQITMQKGLNCNALNINQLQRGDFYYEIIDVNQLKNEPSPEMILFYLLSNYGFTSAMIEQIYDNMEAPSGRIWKSSTHTLATDRGQLLICSNEYLAANNKTMKIPESGIYIYNERAKVAIDIQSREADFQPSKEQYCVTLDADKVRLPITIRPTQEGDRFKPFGMRGTKLVSDYMTNRKKNYFQRMQQLVAEDATGEIVWLVGERTSQVCSCNDNTINVMTIRFINE